MWPYANLHRQLIGLHHSDLAVLSITVPVALPESVLYCTKLLYGVGFEVLLVGFLQGLNVFFGRRCLRTAAAKHILS